MGLMNGSVRSGMYGRVLHAVNSYRQLKAFPHLHLNGPHPAMKSANTQPDYLGRTLRLKDIIKAEPK